MKFGDLAKKAKEEGSFDDVIDQGDFTLEILRANSNPKKDGTDQIGVQFKVVAGADNEPLPEDDPALNQKAWVNLHFSEKAANISIRQLKSWGVPEDFLEQAETAKEIADILPGTVLNVSVTHRTWGKDDENVNINLKVHDVVVPPAVGSVDPTEESDESPSEENF